ncbi:MAG: TraB/GumN family protein [Nanohaloarchaea archaeon]|nr:TraB/GumN family protein [Candidatus Nanohaloarchaea archaeon]
MRREVDLGDRKVTLVGTAHVSSESKDEVENTIDEVDPDLVCVELDENRFESLRDESGWKDMNVAEALRQGKGSILFINLLLSIYQRRIGMEQGVKPGEEMLSAVQKAEEKEIDYALVDRDISETFSRVRSELSLWEKMKLLTLFYMDEIDLDVEEIKDENIIDSLVTELENQFPKLSEVFLDERNRFMSEKTLENDFNHAVVVVGAAHLEGIAEILESEKKESVEQLDSTNRIPWMKIAKYGIPTFVILGLGYSFTQIDYSTGLQGLSFWILSNGVLAGLGAVIARSHPLTWLISFLAAPLTSLDPALGAGMVAGYSEAKFYPPKVGELETITKIDSYRELWNNQVGRILLTFVFVTIGSAMATFLSIGFIASLLAGI